MKKQLCLDIEKAIGRELCTPKDFDLLRMCIYERLHTMISATTLKRIWGYLNEEVQTRKGSMNILAQFIGYRDFDDYVAHANALNNEVQSSPVMSRKLNVPEELKPGDCLRILWLPDRQCEVVYLGNLMFRVLSSCNTRLLPNNTFQCGLLIEGEPLYLDQLIQDCRPPVTYVCGKRSGVRFERINNCQFTPTPKG